MKNRNEDNFREALKTLVRNEPDKLEFFSPLKFDDAIPPFYPQASGKEETGPARNRVLNTVRRRRYNFSMAAIAACFVMFVSVAALNISPDVASSGDMSDMEFSDMQGIAGNQDAGIPGTGLPGTGFPETTAPANTDPEATEIEREDAGSAESEELRTSASEGDETEELADIKNMFGPAEPGMEPGIAGSQDDAIAASPGQSLPAPYPTTLSIIMFACAGVCAILFVLFFVKRKKTI